MAGGIISHTKTIKLSDKLKPFGSAKLNNKLPSAWNLPEPENLLYYYIFHFSSFKAFTLKCKNVRKPQNTVFLCVWCGYCWNILHNWTLSFGFAHFQVLQCYCCCCCTFRSPVSQRYLAPHSSVRQLKPPSSGSLQWCRILISSLSGSAAGVEESRSVLQISKHAIRK